MISRVTRILVGALAVSACGGSSNNNHPDASHQQDASHADTKQVDAAEAIDAAPAAETPLPTGAPVVIPLKTISQISYTGPLQTGGQAQDVILDTGSTTLGIAASTCTNCGVAPLYTPGKGAVDQKKTASSMYADQTGWDSEIFSDTVQLGSAASTSVKFGAINSSNGFFRDFDGTGVKYEGILGLGPDLNLIQGTTSYVTGVFGGGVAKEMAFQLCPDGGTMWLGGYDPTAQAGPQAVTPMVTLMGQQPFYMVDTANMSVGHASLGLTSADFGPTILDTGTSIAFIPTAALNGMTSAIEASAGYQAAFGTQSLTDGEGCVQTTLTGAQIDAMLPPIGVSFPGVGPGNSEFVDLPATRSYLVPEGGGLWCYGMADATQLTGGQFTASLFGDSLLAAWTTTIDIDDDKVGFAPQQGCSQADSDVSKRPALVLEPGIPWWKQDPRVRTPDPVAFRRKLGLHE
jgi:hypothetical protein|nr:pepsin-like aspartyl protease [Kofleriaceae bacterium]